VETAALFFKHRASKAKPGDLLSYLDKVPRKAPVPGDELT